MTQKVLSPEERAEKRKLLGIDKQAAETAASVAQLMCDGIGVVQRVTDPSGVRDLTDANRQYA